MDYRANVFPGKIFAPFDFRGAKFLPQTLRPYFPGSNLHVASFLSNLADENSASKDILPLRAKI